MSNNESGTLMNVKLEYAICYPENGIRKTTSLFRATKKQLLKIEKRTCFICDRKSTLEVHHFHVEWAMTNSVDWNKMRIFHPTFDWSKFIIPEDFVDSTYNCIVLCKKHHREKNYGIHCMPYSLWVMQKYVKKGQVLIPNDKIAIQDSTDDIIDYIA